MGSDDEAYTPDTDAALDGTDWLEPRTNCPDTELVFRSLDINMIFSVLLVLIAKLFSFEAI